MGKKSKRHKRDEQTFPGLKKNKFSKIKQEYHDIDYVDKLSDKDKQWLNSFMEEDLGARFNHPNKKIYRKNKDKKASYTRNNARNRDIYSINQAQGKVIRASTMAIENYLDKKQEEYAKSPEDDIIELMDLSKNPIDETEGFEE